MVKMPIFQLPSMLVATHCSKVDADTGRVKTGTVSGMDRGESRQILPSIEVRPTAELDPDLDL